MIKKRNEKGKIYKVGSENNNNILPGDLQRSPDDCISHNYSLGSVSMKKTLVLIDAGFLSKLSKYFGGGNYKKFDIIVFSQNIARKQSLNCERVYYYTAPPFQSENPSREETERYSRYERFKMNLLKNQIITVREGRCQRLKIDGKYLYSQKGVDALVIIDMMSIPLQYKDVKTVILIANDSDFVPVVEKLREVGIQVILYTYYSKNRKSSFSRSNELLNSVSKYVELTSKDFDCALLHDKKGGKDEEKE